MGEIDDCFWHNIGLLRAGFEAVLGLLTFTTCEIDSALFDRLCDVGIYGSFGRNLHKTMGVLSSATYLIGVRTSARLPVAGI